MPQLVQKNKDGTSVKQWDLKGQPISVGRGEDATARVEDEHMSRRHFEIFPKNNGYAVRDLQSRNGTTLNGKAVAETQLGSGDTIRAGNSIFIFSDGLNTVIGQMANQNKSYGSYIKQLSADEAKK